MAACRGSYTFLVLSGADRNSHPFRYRKPDTKVCSLALRVLWYQTKVVQVGNQKQGYAYVLFVPRYIHIHIQMAVLRTVQLYVYNTTSVHLTNSV